MILIHSNCDDVSTNDVIDWLNYFNQKFIRINDNSIFFIETIELDNLSKEKIILKISTPYSTDKTREVDLSVIKSYWYRRGGFYTPPETIKDRNITELIKEFNYYIHRESGAIKVFLYSYLNDIKHIGNYNHNGTNKLYNLFLAKKVGLKIPETLVAKKKKPIFNFFKTNKKVITKSISEGGVTFNNKVILSGLTAEVTRNDLYKRSFFHSLFQKKLDKAYELRIFYLNEKTYTTAIFSQLDKKTLIDFRNYNYLKPNRTPRFNLPKEIEEKIIRLMKTLKMKSGSIDMVVTKSKEFVFLEVNPIGQFHQVSLPGNFFIEKIIAKHLSI